MKTYLFTCLILLFFTSSFSKNYYVSTKGKDTNQGTSLNSTYRTINKAVESAAAGDYVYVLPGTYNELIIISKKSGSPDKPVFISGYSKDKNKYPVINGGALKPSVTDSADWIHIENSNWITVSNMKFINGWVDPIHVNNSSYITIDNCSFSGGRRVIVVTGKDSHHILVENNNWNQGGEYLWKLEKDSAGVEAWLSMHHVNMSYFNGSLVDMHETGGSVVIRNNTIKDAYNAFRWRAVKGYDSNIEIYGNDISYVRDNDFEPEYYTYNLHIYHNFSHNIHRTLSIDNVTGGNIYYYGNVITTDNDPWTKVVCANFGKIYGEERSLDYPLYVFNNSFYGVCNAYRVDVGKAILLKHFNNAFYFSSEKGWILDKWDPSLEFDYDISSKNWPQNIIDNKQEEHGKITDIMFADPLKKNLLLKKGSPGIDAGKVMSFKEFNWQQSFSGKAPEIGAYENNSLVEGPPFRFITPPEGNITYKEKPRIVRYDVKDNVLVLYFSGELNPASIKQGDLQIYTNNKLIKTESLSLNSDNYGITVTAKSKLSSKGLSVSFKLMPVGANGETATYWASAVNIHK